MPNKTQKKNNKRSPKRFNKLEWLRDPKEQLKRSVSFEGNEVSDEEFFRFFEAIGEGSPKNQNRNRSASKSRKSPKAPKSPKATKSPK